MPIYRMLTLGSNRKPTAVTDFEVDNDDVAITHTEQLVDGHDVELWQQGRFVDYFKSRSKKTQPVKQGAAGTSIGLAPLPFVNGAMPDDLPLNFLSSGD